MGQRQSLNMAMFNTSPTWLGILVPEEYFGGMDDDDGDLRPDYVELLEADYGEEGIDWRFDGCGPIRYIDGIGCTVVQFRDEKTAWRFADMIRVILHSSEDIKAQVATELAALSTTAQG